MDNLIFDAYCISCNVRNSTVGRILSAWIWRSILGTGDGMALYGMQGPRRNLAKAVLIQAGKNGND